MLAKKTKPNLFNYDNYRQYISDWIIYLQDNSSLRVTMKDLSQRAGFKSSNYINLVMDNKRNLSGKGIGNICQLVGLQSSAERYFRCLVMLNQAKSDEERQLHQEQMFSERIKHNFIEEQTRESMNMSLPDKKNVSALTLSVSKETAPAVEQMISEFYERLTTLVDQTKKPDNIFHINFQSIPVVHEEENK